MENLSIKELETLLEAVRTFGPAGQLVKAIEELGELTQALCKYINDYPGLENEEHRQSLTDHVAEEMADVAIMLEQLKIILGNHARVDAWTHEKLARLNARVKTTRGY